MGKFRDNTSRMRSNKFLCFESQQSQRCRVLRFLIPLALQLGLVLILYWYGWVKMNARVMLKSCFTPLQLNTFDLGDQTCTRAEDLCSGRVLQSCLASVYVSYDYTILNSKRSICSMCLLVSPCNKHACTIVCICHNSLIIIMCTCVRVQAPGGGWRW